MNQKLLHETANATAKQLLLLCKDSIKPEEWNKAYATVYGMVYFGLEQALELNRSRRVEPSRN